MGRLADKEQLQYRPHLGDVVTLLVHCYWAIEDEEIGFEDADYSFKEIHRKLCKKSIQLPKSAIESALWCCNMLDERNEFWSPRGESFREFVTRLLKDYEGEFDYFYNWIDDPREAPSAKKKEE